MELGLLSLAAPLASAVSLGALDLSFDTSLGPRSADCDGQHGRREANSVPHGFQVAQQPPVRVVTNSFLHAAAIVMLAGLAAASDLNAVAQVGEQRLRNINIGDPRKRFCLELPGSRAVGERSWQSPLIGLYGAPAVLKQV
eukprot:1796197-Pyramimonas_sp.AAC.1